jgi:replicative DNA helicase
MDVVERLPPQSREAERCVLGSMLRDNAVIGDIVQILGLDNFYVDAHQKVFEGIRTLYDLGQPVDLVVVAEWLTAQKYLEDIGGPSYLAELWDAAPTAANAEYYARIVRDKAIIRSLIHTSNEVLRDAFDNISPADEMLESAERKILEIAQQGIIGNTITLIDAMNEAYERIDARAKKEYTHTGVMTGYTDLDELTAGLHANELILLAARPSIGKTALALNIIRNVILGKASTPVKVFFVSLEQSRIEIAERLLIAHARVDSHKLRKGNLSHEDMQRMIGAGDMLRGATLFIDDTPQQSMLRIAANARRLKKRHDISLVVIDYLQLIDPENKRDSRQEQVAQISRRLKFLARELKIPVLALAQVNRSSEDRQEHKPRLSDLRESGSLEQDADTVMMLHRPGKYEGGAEDNIIEIIVAKQRNGPTGEINLTFVKDCMLFENHAFGSGDFV